MRKIDRRIVIVAILVFTIGLAYGLMRYLISLKEEPKSRPPVEMVRYVSAEEVRYVRLFSPVEAKGRLASISELDIVAEAAGKIEIAKIPLKKGAQFSKGDLLFTVYPDEAVLALKARKSQFLTLLVNMMPDIRIDYPKFEKAFVDFYQSIQLDKPLPSLPSLEDQAFKTFLASRNILSEYFTISRDELSLERRKVYAPFDGTYIDVLLEAGAYTNAGGRVAKAIRTDELELEIPLERFHSDFVSIGDPVKVVSERRGKSWDGKVIRKSQFIDPSTQSQSVFIKVINKNRDAVLAGEWLTAVFQGQEIDGVMQVNRNAIFNTNEVFIVVDGRLQKKEINIVKVNEKTLLFNGLEEGTKVVTQPLINVMEGSPVAILGESPIPEGPGKSPLSGINQGNKGKKEDGKGKGKEKKKKE